MKNIEAVLLKNIRIARRTARITLKEAGEVIGVGEAAVSAMENGKIKFTAVNLYKLCEMYKVNIADVFDPNYSAYMNKNSDYQEALKRIEKNENEEGLLIKRREDMKSSNLVHERLKRYNL